MLGEKTLAESVVAIVKYDDQLIKPNSTVVLFERGMQIKKSKGEIYHG